jgi:hypothetical protein
MQLTAVPIRAVPDLYQQTDDTLLSTLVLRSPNRRQSCGISQLRNPRAISAMRYVEVERKKFINPRSNDDAVDGGGELSRF